MADLIFFIRTTTHKFKPEGDHYELELELNG